MFSLKIRRYGAIPANKFGYLIQPDPEFRRHVFRVGKPVAVFRSKAMPHLGGELANLGQGRSEADQMP
jgi:hypothetical protein